MNKFNLPLRRILAVGNALVDTLVNLPDEKNLAAFGMTKGHMTLIENKRHNELLHHCTHFPLKNSMGGSAANTVRAIASLGSPCGYIGRVGKDDLGDFFEERLQKYHIRPFLSRGEKPTGQCISLITPDCERTMATYLGSAVDLTSGDLPEQAFDKFHYLHMEGYLVQNRLLFKKAMKLAKDKGLCLSIDLASPNVVADNLQFLRGAISQYVDIVFANEEEAMTFTDCVTPLDALFTLATYCKIAVLKLGREGSMISYQHTRFHIEPFKVDAADTTGAGDFYAAGFLYGMARGYGLETCGQIASYLGGRAVQIIGTTLTQKTWREIRSDIRRIIQ